MLRVQWPPGLNVADRPAGPGDPGRALGVGEGDDAVGVADVEAAVDERHAERLVQAVEEGLADLGDAVAVGVAQQRDPVRARAERLGALHRRVDRVVERRADAAGHRQRLGGQHVAVRQHARSSAGA